MIRILEYIVFFLITYKMIRLFIGDDAPKKSQPREDQVHFDQRFDQYNNNSSQQSPPSSRFNEAEPIDYEEVK